MEDEYEAEKFMDYLRMKVEKSEICKLCLLLIRLQKKYKNPAPGILGLKSRSEIFEIIVKARKVQKRHMFKP